MRQAYELISWQRIAPNGKTQEETYVQMRRVELYVNNALDLPAAVANEFQEREIDWNSNNLCRDVRVLTGVLPNSTVLVVTLLKVSRD